MSTIVAKQSESEKSVHLKQAFRSLCMKIDSPLGRKLARASDLEIAEASVNPSEYSCANLFRRDYLLVSYLSKYSGLNTGIDTRAVALRSFEAAEMKCAETNRRLRRGSTTFVDPILHRAARLVASVLGEFDESKLHDKERWGPGATAEFTRPEAYMDTKISSLPFTVTASAAPLFLQAIKRDQHWHDLLLNGADPSTFDYASLMKIVPGSRIGFVPKNAKTDRTIAIEPRGNMWLQKAAGSFIRSRLKRVGVDLDKQSINQNLAFEAQLKQLATLDLKSASDTVCNQLIWELLPYDWACYLDRVRSRSFTFDNETYQPFNKFSSMGNGFTFELESLIFWSFTRAVFESTHGEEVSSERLCAIYGDDIICPQSNAWELTTVLNYCGFEINLTKSFYEGNFFESCGKHFFNSVDVTPIYQKKMLTEIGEPPRAYNRLVRYACKYVCGYGFIDRPLFLAVAYKLLARILDRSQSIPFLPMGAEGDDGYLLTDDQMSDLKIKIIRDPNRGQKCVVASLVYSKLPSNEHALYTYKLRVNADRLPELPVCSYRPAEMLDRWGLQDSRSSQGIRAVFSTRWVHPG